MAKIEKKPNNKTIKTKKDSRPIEIQLKELRRVLAGLVDASQRYMGMAIYNEPISPKKPLKYGSLGSYLDAYDGDGNLKN